MCLPTSERSGASADKKQQAYSKDETFLTKGTLYGSISLALIIAGFSLTMPHLQSRRDTLQCDSLCFGSMTSARSALSLLGGFFVSRLSDSDKFAKVYGGSNGRKACLYLGTIASIIGLTIGTADFSIRGMWMSMIPGALFQQNFSVLKALFADYHNYYSSPTEARAASVGKLGMSVGLAFMVGPILGATLIQSYEHAAYLAIVLMFASTIMIAKLPHIKSSESSLHSKNLPSPSSAGGILRNFLDVKAARTPPAIFLMAIRLCMTLAFHIYMTIWTTSLKERFDFGPKQHGTFMSFIGLTYAFSQGVVAKHVVKQNKTSGNDGRRRIHVLQLCCVALGVGRVMAFHTTSLSAVYLMFAGIVSALGVMNTILTGDTATLASPEEVGGLYGVLESVESVAGMVGPLTGGTLALIHPIHAPLTAVVSLYTIVFLMVSWGYEKLILRHNYQTVASKDL